MHYTKPEYDYKHPAFRHRAYIRYAQEHKEMYERLHNSAAISYEIIDTVSPLQIPVVYHVHYRIKSIIGIDGDQNPIYGDFHTMRLELPPEYPIKSSIPYMVTDAWHPNIKSEGRLKGRICSNSVGFGRNFSLSQMVLRVGEILQWKNYLAEFKDPYPEDPTVAEWVLNYAEPNDIVNLNKGLAIDNTPLLEARPDEEPPVSGQATPDPTQNDEPAGFSIRMRSQVNSEDTTDEKGAQAPQSSPDDPTKNKGDNDGGFSITRRKNNS